MAIEVTGTQLLDDLRITADMPPFNSDTRPTEAQALRMLSKSIYKFSHKHKQFGTRFKEDTISAVGGTVTYDLPTDFVALRYLRYTSGSHRRKIRRGDIDDIDREGLNTTGWAGGNTALYMLLGRSGVAVRHQIRFNDPRGAFTVTVGYIPALEVYDSGDAAKAELLLVTDKVMAEEGIDDWIVLDTAIKIWSLEQKDTRDLRQTMADVELTLQAHLVDRDVDEPAVVRNAYDQGGLEDDDLWGDRR